MFKNAYQHGLLTIFSSSGSNPLLIWRVQSRNGHVSIITDPDLKSQVIEVISLNVTNTYITCPKNSKQSLGIRLPYIVMIIKHLHKYFTFEITIIDETKCRRRFRVSNFQTTTTIYPFCTAMPLGLSGGWNQIQFNLAEFTRRAYKLQFAEVVRVQINANVRLRRIYFAERLYTEDELPREYKIYRPIKSNIRGIKSPKINEPVTLNEKVEENNLNSQDKVFDLITSKKDIVSLLSVKKSTNKLLQSKHISKASIVNVTEIENISRIKASEIITTKDNYGQEKNKEVLSENESRSGNVDTKDVIDSEILKSSTPVPDANKEDKESIKSWLRVSSQNTIAMQKSIINFSPANNSAQPSKTSIAAIAETKDKESVNSMQQISSQKNIAIQKEDPELFTTKDVSTPQQGID